MKCSALLNTWWTNTKPLQQAWAKQTWPTFFREGIHQGGVWVSLTFFTGVLLPEAPKSCVSQMPPWISPHTTLHSPPVMSPIKTPPCPSTLKPVAMFTLRKTCAATTGGHFKHGNIPLFHKTLQVTGSLSLTVLISWPCSRPWLITSAASPCVPVGGNSSSSVPPAAFTDTLRHAAVALNEQAGWIPAQMVCSVILMHPQAQLTNTEAPAHADMLRGTGRSPQRQVHREAQTLPPWHPVQTDRWNQTHNTATVTVVLWRHTCFHLDMPLEHLQATSCLLQLDEQPLSWPETHPAQWALIWAVLWWQMKTEPCSLFGLTLAGERMKGKGPYGPRKCQLSSPTARKEVTLTAFPVTQGLTVCLSFLWAL